jgi:periplasmic nitrate reductase NapD
MHLTGPSRRALLKGNLTSSGARADAPLIHISSAIVSVLPSRRTEVIERISALSGVEIRHAESFKIVIVLESEDAGAIGSRLAEIATWNGVLSANMVFEQTEQPSETGEMT